MNKQLFVTGPREVAFRDIDVPDCPDDGVVVKAKLTAVSTGTELRVYRAIPVDKAGKFLHERVPFQLPTINGYSMLGEIIEVGPHAGDLQIGQRVMCRGPHGHYAAQPASFVRPLPDEIADEEGVFITILEVAHKALRQGNPPCGGNVAIIGQGVVGLSLLAYCSSFGCRTAVMDLDQGRLEIARAMGATLAVSPADESAFEQIHDLFDGDGADVAFECASNWAGIQSALEVTRTDGTVVVVSRHTKEPNFNPVGTPFLGKRLNLVTTYGYHPDGHRWDERHSIQLTVDLLRRKQMNIQPMITHNVSWEELPAVYERLDQGDSSIVGVVVKWAE